ncbi:MAG: hypothetical protein RMN25_13715 [Anaerolineae bacterium]|nr:hypothetical protein [Thermoflexales bacterium]MDW8408830.1 hypothetical protein [Anaerolineae bacterium]
MNRMKPVTRRCTAVTMTLAVFSTTLVACAGASSTPVVTLPVTILAPTITPLPSATPVPPTPTPLPTATADTHPLRVALHNTATAGSYRVQITMTGLGEPLAVFSGDLDREVTLLTVIGDYHNGNAAFTMSGPAGIALGSNQDQLQLIVSGDEAYLFGPAPLLGAVEADWYALPAEQSQLARFPADIPRFLEALLTDDSTHFQPAAAEDLDAEADRFSCMVYLADAQAARAALDWFGASVLPGVGSLIMQAGELALWACDDGYVHRLRMRFDLDSNDAQGKQLVFMTDVRLYDFGAQVTVLTPTDARPLDLPGLGTSSP